MGEAPPAWRRRGGDAAVTVAPRMKPLGAALPVPRALVVDRDPARPDAVVEGGRPVVRMTQSPGASFRIRSIRNLLNYRGRLSPGSWTSCDAAWWLSSVIDRNQELVQIGLITTHT